MKADQELRLKKTDGTMSHNKNLPLTLGTELLQFVGVLGFRPRDGLQTKRISGGTHITDLLGIHMFNFGD